MKTGRFDFTKITMIGAGVCGSVLLALILYPVFARPSQPYGHHSCLSNVKILSTSLAMYVQDNDGRFPRAAVWMDSALPYIKTKEAFRCPKRYWQAGFGYGFNAALTTKFLNAYKAPTTVVTLYDSGDLHWNYNAPGLTGVANPPRHQYGNSFGFADGHAKWKSLTAGGQ
jgi:hypothetical protein